MDKNVIKLVNKNGEPIIRVFLFQGQRHVDFVLKKPFDVIDLKGNKILEDVNSKLRWRIKIKENNVGDEIFRLILWETKIEDEAKRKEVHILPLQHQVQNISHNEWLKPKSIEFQVATKTL